MRCARRRGAAAALAAVTAALGCSGLIGIQGPDPGPGATDGGVGPDGGRAVSDGAVPSPGDGAAGSPDGGTTPGTPGACPGGQAAFDALAASLKTTFDQAQGRGAALAVVCGGRLAHTAAFGTVRAGGEAVTSKTRFQLASVTKMFTAAAAVRLVEDGRMSLQAPVSTYISGLGFGHVTIHQLATHTAGIPTQFANYRDDLGAYITANASSPLWSPPGVVWNYSNDGYDVLGRAVEVAGGQAFADLIEQKLFAPAGMTTATMKVSRILAEGSYAWGHYGTAASHEVLAPDGAYWEPAYYGPMGGAWGSVEDLAHWAEAHLAGGGAVLSSAGFASLREPYTKTTYWGTSYGYGLFVDVAFAPRVARHSGGTTGFLSNWVLVPDQQFAVVAVSNGDWFWPGDLTDAVLEHYVPLSVLEQPPQPSPPDYVGTYTDPYNFGTVRIQQSGATLQAVFVDTSQTVDLTHYLADSYGFYYAKEGMEADLTFWRQPGQPAQYLVSMFGVAPRTGP